jgi:hypothetical protein
VTDQIVERTAVEDKMLSMMADQQEELTKFRENVNARLATLERTRTRKSGGMEWDFERLAGIGLLLIFALIVARIAFAALALHKARENDGNFQVSEA